LQFNQTVNRSRDRARPCYISARSVLEAFSNLW
jgi:hypothetical protein